MMAALVKSWVSKVSVGNALYRNEMKRQIPIWYTRNFSDLLEKKEQAEEARYIRQMEEKEREKAKSKKSEVTGRTGTVKTKREGNSRKDQPAKK